MSSLWGLALGIGATAGLAGSLAVPAARKIAFGDIEHDWLNDEIEFDKIDIDNSTVICKNGLFVNVFELRGEAYETKPFETQAVLNKGRTTLINEFALLGITARFFGVKRLKDISHQAEWQSPALKEIGDAESETFKRAYEIRWFMVLQCKTYRNLGEISEKIFSTYKVYKPKLLKTPIDKSKPCPLTCFLNYLVCGDLRDDLKAVSSNISGNLQGADTIWDREAGTMTAHIPLPYIYKSVTVTSWSDMINGAIINSIMNLKGELEVSQVLKPVKKERMTASFARKARETNANPFGNKALAEECTAAVALLSEGELSFYQTQFCINIRAKNLEKLNTLLESLTASLAKDGLRYSIETECMPISWFNRFAGRDRLARPLKLRNDDIAALWAWQFAPIGLIKSYWSNQPVRSFATASGQAYAFQFQATEAKKALGNFAVFAPSGVGKSTLIMHLFGGLAKNKNFKTFILDSKEGARYMIEAMGGVYQSYDKLALNPLDVSEDTPSTRMHISKIVRTMIGDVEKSEDMDELIAHLLDTAFTLPVEHRTFNGLFDLCFSRQTDLRRSFRKWVTDNKGNKGFYSHIFNSKRDTLSSFLGDSFMVGINMNEALENPELAAPIVTHISTAIERIAQQGTLDGFAIFIDEAANLLRNETFRNHTTQLFREYRKLRGAVGMAFQDPNALFKSGIADAVIENTSCFFFFPNPQANRDAYEAFNLNDEQKNFIWGGGIDGRKVLLLKRDAGTGFEESVILDVDLSSLGSALRFYRSGSDAVRELEQIKNQWGDKWLEHLK